MFMLLFTISSYSQVALNKKGGVSFRVDNNTTSQKWIDYSTVFNNHGFHFGFSQYLDQIISDTAYMSLLRNLTTEGHELLDHTPSGTTNYFKVLNNSDTTAYSGNSFVDHINGTKVCLKYVNTFTVSQAPGLVDIVNGNQLISHDTGAFYNINGTPNYFAIYIPALNEVFTYSSALNKITSDPDTLLLKSFWYETITLSNALNLVYYKLTQYDLHLPIGSRGLLAQRDINLCNQFNLPLPKTFIHPNSYTSPYFTKKEIKEVWGDVYNYNGGSSYQLNAYKCYDEYDPVKEKRFGMQGGDFTEEGSTLQLLKTTIANGIAKHYVLIGQSYLYNPTGGWTGFLSRMDSLLYWLQTKNIPVKTYSEWASILYDSTANPFVNIFPAFNVDLDSNYLPDGFYNPAIMDSLDGVAISGNKSFYKAANGTLCEVQNLTGIEKGTNRLFAWAKGAGTDSIQFKITFPESAVITYKKIPANQSTWTKYYVDFDVPDTISKVTINASVTNYTSSSTVKISGIELRKLSKIKLINPGIQTKMATQIFTTVSLSPLIIDSLYPLNQITITKGTGSQLTFSIDTNNILSITKPSLFWIGKDSVKIKVSNPDLTSDSSYFVFESVQPYICINDSIHINMNTGGLNYIWTSQPTDNSLVAGNHSSQFVSPKTSTNYQIKVVNTPGDTSIYQVSVTVYNPPIVDAGNNITTCIYDTITLVASGASTYIWNNNVIQGQAFSLITQGYYKVIGTDIHGCKASDSLLILMVPSLVTGNIDTITPICYNTSAILHLSNNYGNIQWQIYSGNLWVDVSGANQATLITSNLTSSTNYRVKIYNNYCTPKYSSAVTVVVYQPATGGILIADSVVCDGLMTSISLTGNNGDIQWQYSLNGINGWTTFGNTLMNNPTIYTPPITQKTYFRAIVSSGSCSSAYSTIDSIITYPQALGGIINHSIGEICTNNTSNLSLTGYNGNIQWQMSQNNGTTWTTISGDTTSHITTPVLTTTTIFRSAVSNTYCYASYSLNDTIIVDSLSKSGTLSVTSPVCQGTGSFLNLIGNRGTTIKWLQSTDSTNWVNASGVPSLNSFATSAINSTTWYKAIVTNNTCPADTGLSKPVKTDSLSIGGIALANNSLICSGDSTWLNVSNYRGNIQWQISYNMGQTYGNVNANYTGANTSTLYTPPLTSTYVYRASIKNGVCVAAYSTPDTIVVNQMTVPGYAIATSPICPNTTTKVYLYAYLGQIQWQKSTDTINWTNVTTGINLIGSPYTTDTILANTYYRAMVKNGVCPIKFSIYDTVVVLPVINPSISITMIAGLNPQCLPGDTVVYKAIIANADSNPTFHWYKNNLNVGTNDSIYNFIPHNNDKVKCKLTPNYLCPSTPYVYSNIDSITVNPLPVITFNLPTFQDTVCSTLGAFMIAGGNPFGGYYSGFGVDSNAFYPAIAGLGLDTVYYVYKIPSTGCTDSAGKPIMVVYCAGINELNANMDYTIYPNPAKENICLNIPSSIAEAEISLENISGETINTYHYRLANAQNKFIIDVDKIARGVYFLKLKNNKYTIVKKLILE